MPPEILRVLTSSERAIAQRRWIALQDAQTLWEETLALLTGADARRGINTRTWELVELPESTPTPTGETDGTES